MTLRFPDGETEGWEGMYLTHSPLTWTTQEHMSRALRKLPGAGRAAEGKLPEGGGTWHASGLGRKKEAGPRIRQGTHARTTRTRRVLYSTGLLGPGRGRYGGAETDAYAQALCEKGPNSTTLS